MDLPFIKQILSTLSTDAFNKFVFELCKSEDCNNDTRIVETYPIPKLGQHIYEQHILTRLDKNSAIEAQGYNLILPFSIECNLFQNQSDYPLTFLQSQIEKIIAEYKIQLLRRQNEWYWPQMGEYYLPKIALITNLSGVQRSYYFDVLLPWLDKILEKSDILANPLVGSYDSFFEINPIETTATFKKFINTYNKELVLSINDGIEVNEFVSEKYLDSGVLKKSHTPLETLFVIKNKSKLISEFEFLVSSDKREKELQNFIKENYQIIFGEEFDRIETEIWLRHPELDINNKNRRIDFFLRNSIDDDWELVELKRAKKIITHYRNDIPRFTAELYSTIQQVENYKRILQQDSVKRQLANDGIEYIQPEYKIIIGRKPQINATQWRILKKSAENGLKIITYDDIIKEMNLRFIAHANIWGK